MEQRQICLKMASLSSAKCCIEHGPWWLEVSAEEHQAWETSLGAIARCKLALRRRLNSALIDMNSRYRESA